MSIQSDAAKRHLEHLLTKGNEGWCAEWQFCHGRRWRFDYAVPNKKFAIELDGGLFVQGAHSNPAAIRKNYEKMNMAATLGWRVWRYAPEQVIKAGRKGTHGFFSLPPIIFPCACETLPDEPVLVELPWVEHTTTSVIV